MDRSKIMAQMTEENVAAKIIQAELDRYEIVLRPCVVSKSLEGKLSQEDIAKGMEIVNRQMELSNIRTKLYTQCCNVNCAAKNQCAFRALPNGNTNADIMFISKMPTDYEIATMTSHSDKNGVFLSLILDKMNVPRDLVYCTDMIKCNAQLDEQSFKECVKTYLSTEIHCISPKVIVCNGLSVLKACIKHNILQDLPLDVTYGKLYDAKTASGITTKVVAIYDLETVLKKTDADYEKCKSELWAQILSAFKAI